jgi:hypothetical protein
VGGGRKGERPPARGSRIGAAGVPPYLSGLKRAQADCDRCSMTDKARYAFGRCCFTARTNESSSLQARERAAAMLGNADLARDRTGPLVLPESQDPHRIVVRVPFVAWAHLGSNQGPLACEASALPLSYAPGRSRLAKLEQCPKRSGLAASRRYDDAGCGDASPSGAGTDGSRKAGSGGRWPGSFRGIRCRTRRASSGSTRASSGLIRGTSGGSVMWVGSIEGSIGRDRLRLQPDVPCTSESVAYGTVRRACTTAAPD